ncbi:ATP-binding protein [Pendulispora rubella]|uniref:histidine kinase n=1 Tax=Pendulispora rubella TaxID=2741070 RepID=A0ABZ2LHE6_9BACT
MKALGLGGRFLVAGVLLVATSAASSAWSALAFRRVSLVVDSAVRASEQTVAATGALASDLEREDDALLLTLADAVRGRRELHERRALVERSLSHLDALLEHPEQREKTAALRVDVRAYHEAGDALLAHAHDADTRIRYHEEVNPLLRRAVSDSARLREDDFRSTQSVAAWARDQASQATQILAVVFSAALLLSILVALYLARVVLLPIGELSRGVEAIRRGDFSGRVRARHGDELGQLADGFNRMADDLEEFRRANIGEVIAAKETLEATLAALPDAVLVVESGGNVSSANARATEVMRNLSLPEAVRTALDASLRGEVVSLPLDLSRALVVRVGEEHRRVLPRIVPIEGLPNGRHGAVLLLSDVTELARLDELRLELVAVASHELRTPLTTLRMTLLMLEERAGRLDETNRELVLTALMGVEQLAGTVAEFLDLTRIEAGELRLQSEQLDLGLVLRQTLAAIQPRADESNRGIRLHLPTDTAPLALHGDLARLTVVFSNILQNALKYTPSGSAIDVGVARADEKLRVTIADRGPGVPEEFRERIFDKFFRVEHYRLGSDVHGSGIGLYIAREIIHAHGGSIACEPVSDGPGACIVVTLPESATTTPREA